MKTDLIISLSPQGSDEWHFERLGVGTASKTAEMIAGKKTATRATYMNTLIAQVATRELPEQINARALDWGKAQEPLARSAYEFMHGNKVEEVGFIYRSDKRLGASPDGLIKEIKKGIEIKNPYSTANHIDFLLMDKIKLEYIYQVQFSLWITGLETWDFCSFDQRMKNGNILKVHTLEADLVLFERFENEIGEFLLDMDKGLEKLSIEWGSQWR